MVWQTFQDMRIASDRLILWLMWYSPHYMILKVNPAICFFQIKYENY
jgi:hypothetical protein